MCRIVVFCLMLLVPLQWTAVALAGIGPHPCGGCTTMHLDGDTGQPAAPEGAPATCGSGATGAGCDSGCGHGHGPSLPALLTGLSMPWACPGDSIAGDHPRHFRSHVPEHPLRPPAAQLA